MAQRSPTNPRYQKYTKPSGKTRKSAASAKPKRQSSSPAEKSSSSSSSSSSKPAPPPLPAELRPWRIVWWALLGAGMVAALGAYLLQRNGDGGPLGVGLLVFAYACIIGGLAIDWLKVRPARKAAMSGASSSTGKGKSSGDKEASPKAKTSGKSDTTDEDADDADG